MTLFLLSTLFNQMIDLALKILAEQVDAYLKLKDNSLDPIAKAVELQNIALHENGGGGSTIPKKVILSLVNIEEEKTLKNLPHYKISGNNTEYKQPPIKLNLFLLFSANHTNYETALKYLSYIIQFFQGKQTFTFQNSPLPSITLTPELNELRLILEIHSLSFEQINYLWGSLGGKQMPFVMYKARLLEIQPDQIQGAGQAITEINGELGELNP